MKKHINYPHILSVNGLKTYFSTERGVFPAVDGISFNINQGETFCLVGESGCGKSVTALSIMGLVAEPGKIISGSIIFEGQDLLKIKKKEMQGLRGNRLAMIFQEPVSSLNPVLRVGEQITEILLLHKDFSANDARDKGIELFRDVGIPAPEIRIDDYPHQMSGGMCQRVMIAMALCCNPGLIIADEPTTALDVTIQAQIINLMNSIKDKYNASIMLITHDLAVVAEMAQMVAIMYAGKIVEQTDINTLFESPMHPYTIGLLDSIPGYQGSVSGDVKRLRTIPGIVPELNNLPSGCSFNDRCAHAFDRCFHDEPHLKLCANGHYVSCFKYDQV